MQPKQTPLQRALSRKFLVTLAALVAIYHQAATLDLWSKVLIAAVAAVYVCGETVLDKAGQTHLAEVIRTVLGPASAPASASNLLANALTSEALTPEAKGVLSQAKSIVDSVAGASHPPVTTPSAGTIEGKIGSDFIPGDKDTQDALDAAGVKHGDEISIDLADASERPTPPAISS